MKSIPDLSESDIARFKSKYEESIGCWVWKGAVNKRGYASFGISGKVYQAHRVAYRIANGPGTPSPELTIDHVRSRGCVSRACVNPAHLEEVAHEVNSSRGRHKGDYCDKGHLYVTQASGHRRCPVCTKARTDEWIKKTGRGGYGRVYEKKTHCSKGHPRIPENLIGSNCKICKRQNRKS